MMSSRWSLRVTLPRSEYLVESRPRAAPDVVAAAGATDSRSVPQCERASAVRRADQQIRCALLHAAHSTAAAATETEGPMCRGASVPNNRGQRLILAQMWIDPGADVASPSADVTGQPCVAGRGVAVNNSPRMQTTPATARSF